jgi:uncharacterized Fe-S center protein
MEVVIRCKKNLSMRWKKDLPMGQVYFTPLSLQDNPEKIKKAIAILFQCTGFLDKIQPQDLIAIKIHFGEEGNQGYIRPQYAAVVAQAIQTKHGKPFFTDTNTLYAGRRSNAVDHLVLAYEHGFTPEVLGSPVIIADGLLGNAEVKVKIAGHHFKEVPIARELAFCNGIVSMNHFKGHLVTHFGGALKNLGMGGSSRAGKLLQHSSLKPRVKEKRCVGCRACLPWCSTQSISIGSDKNKAFINPETCIGCGQCLSICQHNAIAFNWNESSEILQEKMVEHALGVVKGKEAKTTHLTFLTHITAECDCLAKNEPPVMQDIGIIASNDPVAIDQAALDLANQKESGAFGKATGKSHLPVNQLSYAASLGMGSMEYTLKTVQVQV